MADEVSMEDVAAAMKQIGTVIYREREINLMAGFEKEAAKSLVNDYLKANPSYEFVGLPHLAESRRHVALDPAHPTFYKASTTLDWAITPTGQGTFDAIFPETASQRIRLITNTIPHWALIMGFLEVGSASNLQRISPDDINGKARGRITANLQSRLGDVKLRRIGPALLFPSRGSMQWLMEFENASEVEIIPLAAHIVPQEVLRSDYQTLSVVTNAA